MAQISFRSIFDGISLALSSAFPDADIFGDETEQNIGDGDFIVLPIKPSHNGEMGARARRSLMVDIMYYPTTDGGKEEALEVAEELPIVLSTISTPEGDSVHGTGFDYSFEDGVLHCIVSFPHFVYLVSSDDYGERSDNTIDHLTLY